MVWYMGFLWIMVSNTIWYISKPMSWFQIRYGLWVCSNTISYTTDSEQCSPELKFRQNTAASQ